MVATLSADTKSALDAALASPNNELMNLLNLTNSGAAEASKAMILDSNSAIAGWRLKTSIKTAAYTVTAADSGTIFFANAVDLIFTLPATVAGLWYGFVAQAVSVTTGLSISPAAADAINDNADDTDYVNTGATDVIGDGCIIVGNGTTGWFTIGERGTWT
jgi:hypothetical protein